MFAWFSHLKLVSLIRHLASFFTKRGGPSAADIYEIRKRKETLATTMVRRAILSHVKICCVKQDETHLNFKRYIFIIIFCICILSVIKSQALSHERAYYRISSTGWDVHYTLRCLDRYPQPNHCDDRKPYQFASRVSSEAKLCGQDHKDHFQCHIKSRQMSSLARLSISASLRHI